MNITRVKALALALVFCAIAGAQTVTKAPPASGGAPTGACGGDLGGTYPNCSVLKINGATAPTFPAGPIVGTTDTQTLTNKTLSESQVTNLTTDLAAKAPLVSPAFTTPNIGVATATSLNGVSAAVIAFLDATSSVQAQLNLKAPLASPTFTGNVTIGTSVLSTGQQIDVLCSGDVTTTFQAAINAQSTAGGGTVRLSAGSCFSTAQITIPNDAAAVPHQLPIKLQGAGPMWDGAWGNNGTVVGATVLDLRYSGTPAKIDTRGLGILTVEGISFANTNAVSDTTPFIQTTNTTLHLIRNSFTGAGTGGAASVTDAIVLGGGQTAYILNGTATASFSGYGTIIQGNFFGKIRRGVYGRSSANAVVIRDNTWSDNCGGPSSVGAVEFNGTGDSAAANVLSGNVIEVGQYVYGVRLTKASVLGAQNTFWDPTGPTLAAFFFTDILSSFTCDSCYLPFDSGSGFRPFLDFNGVATSTAARWTAGTNMSGHYRFNGVGTAANASAFIISPDPPAASEGVALFQVSRSQSDANNPNGVIFNVTQGGNAALAGLGATPGATFIIKNGSPQITYDHTSIVKNSGWLNIYPGSGATDAVAIPRGYFEIPKHTTAARQAANNFDPGATYFDTTLGIPLWGNGTNWVDATGATR